jgi:hypothetical protein
MMNDKNYPGLWKVLPVAVLIGMLLLTACGTASSPQATTSGDNNTAGQSTSTPEAVSAAGATTDPQTNTTSSNPKCDALFLANYDMGMALAQMVTLTADTNYAPYTTPGSPFYLDFKKLRSELDTLATLPDPSAADALIAGKPSDAVVYFKQLMDMAEADIKNQGNPFVDTSPSGVKLIGFDTAWEQKAAVFSLAMSNVCKDYTAPSDLFAGTQPATSGASQATQDDSAMATLAANANNMIATVNALSTTMPDQPTETPVP